MIKPLIKIAERERETEIHFNVRENLIRSIHITTQYFRGAGQ